VKGVINIRRRIMKWAAINNQRQSINGESVAWHQWRGSVKKQRHIIIKEIRHSGGIARISKA